MLLDGAYRYTVFGAPSKHKVSTPYSNSSGLPEFWTYRTSNGSTVQRFNIFKKKREKESGCLRLRHLRYKKSCLVFLRFPLYHPFRRCRMLGAQVLRDSGRGLNRMAFQSLHCGVRSLLIHVTQNHRARHWSRLLLSFGASQTCQGQILEGCSFWQNTMSLQQWALKMHKLMINMNKIDQMVLLNVLLLTFTCNILQTLLQSANQLPPKETSVKGKNFKPMMMSGFSPSCRCSLRMAA